MFVVTFVIMLPISIKTGDPIKGWEAGLVWVFFQSFIRMIGGFVAPYIRKVTPRAALLGTLAGVSVTFIAMRPALEMFMTPIIGIVLLRYHQRGAPGSAASSIRRGFLSAWWRSRGMLIAWVDPFGINYGGMSVGKAVDPFASSVFRADPGDQSRVLGFHFLHYLVMAILFWKSPPVLSDGARPTNQTPPPPPKKKKKKKNKKIKNKKKKKKKKAYC